MNNPIIKAFSASNFSATDFNIDLIKAKKELDLIQKTNSAIVLLKKAISKHGNKIICGYSGGKDSKVILHLAQTVLPNIIPVHNSHPEETCDMKAGCVVIKEPKSNFAEYLKVVDIVAQIDGTRVYEEGKTVIFNGVEIERYEMKYDFEYNPKGVFGLEIYYPILFWSDKDVWDYIGQHSLMTAYEIATYKSSRSYRGEIF